MSISQVYLELENEADLLSLILFLASQQYYLTLCDISVIVNC